MRFLLALTAALSFGFVSTAAAAPYGAAGCGLGSIVFGDKPGMVQVLAVTTNASFYSQTFGITFGTSNCAQSGNSGEKMSKFIESNRDAFAKDVARGEGETINAIAKIAGCSDANNLGQTLKSNFKTIFPAAKSTSTQVTNNVTTTIKNSTLVCGNLG